MLIACAAAGAPPTPAVVDATTKPTQSIAGGTGPQSATATALPTLEASAQTAAVRRGTIEEIVTLAGRVVGRNDLPIAASAVTQTRRIFVAPGRTVSEGQPLIETEGTDRQRRTDENRGREQAAARRAEADLAEAVRTLQDASRGPETVEVEVASREVQAALRKLESSREHLAVLQSGPPRIEIDAANAAVEGARATLEQSQARRVALNAGAPAGQVAAARAAVTSARAALAAADERVSELTGQQRSQEQALSQARAQIDLLRGIQSGAVQAPDEAAKPGADPDIVEFADAQKELAEARAEVGTVDGGPDATTLVAPTAGMVIAVLTGPGEETGPNRPAVVMVKTDDLVAQVSLESR
jgi:multidrug resistance efflux pump